MRLYKSSSLKLSTVNTPYCVRGVQIPKTNGKTDLLGIPTVIDRMVQQAIVQVLSPLFDPSFSDNSYGFRPKRSEQGAISEDKEFVKSGKSWAVDGYRSFL